MLKPQKNSPRTHLKDLNDNSSDSNRVTRSPVDLYNTKIRKTGQPILTEEEYSKMMKEKFNKRKKEPGDTMFIFLDNEEIEVPVDANLVKEIAEFPGVIKKDNNDRSQTNITD